MKDGRLPPLFVDEQEFRNWEIQRYLQKVAGSEIRLSDGECFLGIDSGSTTTKLVLVDRGGQILFGHYQSNDGNAIGAVQNGLGKLQQLMADLPDPPKIARSAVTGYGEDLIRAAFSCDQGIVETVAHFRAARAFDPQVSFILDIGGQDMKAIFVKDGHIQRIEFNEACSSGCGTFIETFARSLGYTVLDFARLACLAEAPCDLGTRCTVFMNSRVKQSLREGAKVADISAGLAYAVVKNALRKISKITDNSVLGDHIIVQGGAFRNPAIHKALEQVLGKPVICPDKAELMGALGAALEARDVFYRLRQGAGLGIGLANLAIASQYRKQAVRCRGCENTCAITKLTFSNENVFYTGNRCERTFSNRGDRVKRGANLYAEKRDLLFSRSFEPASNAQLTIGIPRALNFYENFPFWHTLLVESGLQVRLSDASSSALFESGARTVMSENICFPAKLLHGHIVNLIEARVDRIFYPMVFYEQREFCDAINSFNCPIVSGYPDVVRCAIDPMRGYGIPFDQPAITFQDSGLLKKSCEEYLTGLGVNRKTFDAAFGRALTLQAQYKTEVRRKGAEIIKKARQASRLVVVLAGHPYHADPLVNHKIPEALADMGVDVLSEDAIPLDPKQELDNLLVLTQWEYLNRCFHAAHWTGQQANIEMVQLNSFGCGPDAFALDEVRGILSEYGKHLTVLRIDEIDSLGSARLRLRSMLEALDDNKVMSHPGSLPGRMAPRRLRKTTRLYQKGDKSKTIIVPEFSRFCTPAIVRPIMDLGYHIDILPSPDRESVETGLKYTNNEICYPGIIVIGDTIKALQSGRYDPKEVIIGSWETGGQCRASNISCLIKKALVAAGYEDIPVITLSTRLKPFNPQPELKFNLAKYLLKAMLGMIYTDGISAMYHASVVRERISGEAKALADKWMAPFENGSMPLTHKSIVENLRQAVKEFNNLSTYKDPLPKVGIVGEIYVKYNTFVNNQIVQWLIDQEIEVVLPPLLTFFLGSFIGYQAGVSEHIRKPDLLYALSDLGHRIVQSLVNEADAILDGFHYYPKHRRIIEIAETAKATLHLTHQYGEGWLLSGEIGEFAKAGVKNVLCLQPFGCIANHVVAKGVARRLKEIYPDVNLLFLDLDAGVSEVNFINRAHFFVEQAKAPNIKKIKAPFFNFLA